MPSWFHPQELLVYAPLLLQGLGITLGLSVLVMAISFIGGLKLAIFRFYGLPFLGPFSAGLVYVLRSIPVVMLIALVHFGLMPLLDFHPSVFASACVALSLSTSAYVSEILRGGFASLRREEIEAAKSLGFNTLQRLVYIFVPLAVGRMLPAIVNQFVTLIKDTSLASIIGLIELTRAAEIIYETTMHEAMMLLVIAIIYFFICYGLSRLARHLERRYNFGH